MKVLIVNDYGTPTGGAELMSLSLRDGLRARGHEARFFASTARDFPVENLADETCFGTATRLRTYLQAANPMAARRLRAVLKDFRPDIVHVRMFLTQLSPLILPPLREVPSILHVVNYRTICPTNLKLLPGGSACQFKRGVVCYRQGCLPLRYWIPLSMQMHLWERWRDAFDRIVANSEWVRQRLRADGVPVDEAVWNGVPVVPARAPLESPPTVAFAGRMVAKKGIDVLVRAVAQVAEQVPGVRLILAGDGPERPAIEALVATLNLGARTVFPGHVARPELERILAGAWVQAVPSLWEEPFGLVSAESMMRGTAVVVSESGGLGEQVRDGETGFRVPPGDSNALADALARLLGDRARAEVMGRAARQFALEHFSEARVVERFLEIYQQLCHEPSAPNARTATAAT